jgi:hypothetical protein
LFFGVTFAIWCFPTLALSGLDISDLGFLIVPALVTVGWFFWQPKVSAGTDHSTANGPDFRGCVEYDRVNLKKTRVFLFWLQANLLFVSLYIFRTSPYISVGMTILILWFVKGTYRPGPTLSPRVIAMYRPAVANSGTFSRGYAVAENFDELERVAEELGVPPLSTFGFAEAIHGETTQWSSAAQVVPTLRALQQHLADTGEKPDLFFDIEALLGAALRSEQEGGEVALLVRCSNVTSTLQWNRNGGSP